MIINHGSGRVFNFAVCSKIIQLTQTQRRQIGLGLLKLFINKLFLFICLESVFASILFGTGYVAILNY